MTADKPPVLTLDVPVAITPMFLVCLKCFKFSNFLVVPHITDAIQNWIREVAKKPVDGSGTEPDICVIELGGVIGDIEGMPYIEAMRQLQFKVGAKDFCNCHVSLIPETAGGEMKSKPTQMSVRELRGCGFTPDVVRFTHPDLSFFLHFTFKNLLIFQ
eukprot:TCONS_00043744-protein